MGSNILGNAFEFLKKTVWKCTHKDAAKMLIGMGAIGFALSSMAQCFAIKINDKIDNRKKNFLLMQEAADGAVNIGLFLALTSSVWKVSDKILSALGICKPEKTLTGSTGGIDHVKSGGRILTTMLASVAACNIITPLIRNVIAGKIRAYKDKKEYEDKMALNNINNLKKISSFKNFDNWAVSKIKNNYTNSLTKYPYNNSGSLKI